MFKKKTKKESESTLLITNPNQKNSRVDYNEIYRHIRTNIEYSAVGQDIKVINITSAAPFPNVIFLVFIFSNSPIEFFKSK